MASNFFPYPYADTTKEDNGIIFTDLGDGSIKIQGTSSDYANFSLISYADPITLQPGDYTLKGTGTSAVEIALVSTALPIRIVRTGEYDLTFTVSETGNWYAQIVVNPNVTVNMTFTPVLFDMTIDSENSRQIRHAMQVAIEIAPDDGDPIIIDNTNLISATVCLRSDLSRIEPALPESEIEIEAYFDEDMTEALTDIPEETPITYSAGYTGDMSPVRNFYLHGQIEWNDNVLYIKGRDQVHLLDAELPYALSLRYGIRAGYETIAHCLSRAGITFTKGAFGSVPSMDTDYPFIVEKGSMRDIIAAIMWMFKTKIDSTANTGYDKEVRPEYVDAGRPRTRIAIPAPTRTIFEGDCADVKNEVERTVQAIDMKSTNLDFSGSRYKPTAKVGSFDWYERSGAFLNIEEHAYSFFCGIKDNSLNTSKYYGMTLLIPGNKNGGYAVAPLINYVGHKLFDSDVPQTDMGANYTQVIPWDCNYDDDYQFDYASQEEAWNALKAAGIINSDEDSTTLDLYGGKAEGSSREDVYTFGTEGEIIELTVDAVSGTMMLRDSNDKTQEIFPAGLARSIAETPRRKGSFTWKGDPRIQPRDRVIFQRIDGKKEIIKIETITLKHERGGLTSEITYRYDGPYTTGGSYALYTDSEVYAGDDVNAGGN